LPIDSIVFKKAFFKDQLSGAIAKIIMEIRDGIWVYDIGQKAIRRV